MEKKTTTTSPIDELLKVQRSEQTKTKYVYYVNKFCRFHNTTPQKLLTLKDDAIRTMQKDYLVYLNEQKLSRSYIAGIVSGLDKFFVMNDREGAMLTKKLRNSIIPQTQTQKLSGRGAWDDKDIKLMMETADNIQTKAIIGILNSTGGRLGIITENVKNVSRYLKYEDVVDDSNKFNFAGQGREIEKIEFGKNKAIRLYSDTGSEYWGFLIPSASVMLDRHLQRRRINDLRFRNNPKGQPLFVAMDKKTKQLKPASYADVKQAIGYVIKNIRGTLPDGQKRHFIQMTNGFRHRFVDKAIQGGMQPLAISKLMSHSGGALDILTERGFTVNKVQVKNYQASVKVLFEEWRKALPYLEYDTSAVDKAELDKAQETIKNQNEFIGKKSIEQDKKIEELQKKVDELQKLRFDRVGWNWYAGGKEYEEEKEFLKIEKELKSQNLTDGSKKLSEHNSNEVEVDE